MVMPGEHCAVYLTLLHRMVMMPGQAFTIRENNINVATGIITSILNNVPIAKDLAKIQLNH